MKKTLPSVYILIAAVLWGCIGLFYKQLARLGFSQLQVVFLRVGIASVGMAIYIAVKDRSWFRIRMRDIWMFIGTGIISLAFFNYCYFSAMDELSLSVAAALLYTAPIFVMLMSAMLFRERMTVRKITAVAVTFVGCVLVTGALGGGTATPHGILFGLGSGLGYALYTVFSVYALRRYRTETVTFYTFVFAALSVCLLCRPFELPTLFSEAPTATVGYSLAIALVACMLPYYFYTKGLEDVSAAQASVMATLEPVVACVIGVLAFRDTLSVFKTVGIVLIVASICLLHMNFPKRS